jgi:predicted adenylyl cyclase CyaB
MEIEAKLKLPDPDGMRRRLREASAVPCGQLLQSDAYFDTLDGRLRRADAGLRLRYSEHTPQREGDGPGRLSLQYKGPATGDSVLRRDEWSLPLAPGAHAREARSLLEGLGYFEVLSFTKRRELWSLDGCEVALDALETLDTLGHFVEIEGPSESAVTGLIDRLGLAGEASVRASYLELVAQQRGLMPGD